MQRTERDVKYISQAFTGKTKKDYHVSQWGVRRTISEGGCFIFFYKKLLIFESH